MGYSMSEVDKNRLAWLQKWPAPAKLNLMLRIVGQRADGYHLLQTVFQLVELCDWLRFYPLSDGSVRLKTPLVGVPEATDLTVRAALLLKKASGCQQGVCIEIEKQLPLGGGLGGGSSDAATTLLVLNKLWQLNYSIEGLMQLGLQLGADVPVFIYGFSAWAEGVGEKLQKIILPEQWFVIIKPNCEVSTKEIFLAKELTRDSKPITIADFVNGQQQNDCLAVVSMLYPNVKKTLIKLSAIAPARLTGTGACVFAQFDSEELARTAYILLRDVGQTYLTRGLSVSSLHIQLEKF
jgi:4-diphosphocytidyl-2-C-methyl-D-erythritol kinase